MSLFYFSGNRNLNKLLNKNKSSNLVNKHNVGSNLYDYYMDKYFKIYKNSDSSMNRNAAKKIFDFLADRRDLLKDTSTSKVDDIMYYDKKLAELAQSGDIDGTIEGTMNAALSDANTPGLSNKTKAIIIGAIALSMGALGYKAYNKYQDYKERRELEKEYGYI